MLLFCRITGLEATTRPAEAGVQRQAAIGGMLLL